MTSHSSTPVGASNSHPNTATPSTGAPTTAGQGVPGSGTAVPVTTVDFTNPALCSARVAAAKRFRLGFLALLNDFESSMRTRSPGSNPRVGKVNSRRLEAIPHLSDLARSRPTMTTVNPDAIDAEISVTTAMQMIVHDVTAFEGRLNTTVALDRGDAWRLADVVLGNARTKAKTDEAIAADLAPIDAILANGSRTVTTPSTVHATTQRANRVQTRAAKAQARAQKAAALATLADQTRALRHPTAAAPVPATPGVNPQGPAPEPASVYQGPALNPQGPAAGR